MTTTEIYAAPPPAATDKTVTPHLMARLSERLSAVRNTTLVPAADESYDAQHQRDLIEELIAWSTDPEGMDRDALRNVDRHGWGIEG